MIYYARRHGQNYGDENNKVDNSVSGSWTQFGLIEDTDRVIHFQGILWDGTGGDFLTLRDKYENVIYYTVNASPMLEPDVLPSFITVKLPLEYLTNASSSSIKIFGEYVL